MKLKQVPVDGGEERVVLEGVPGSHWAVTEKGIFFLTRGSGIRCAGSLPPRYRKGQPDWPFAIPGDRNRGYRAPHGVARRPVGARQPDGALGVGHHDG